MQAQILDIGFKKARAAIRPGAQDDADGRKTDARRGRGNLSIDRGVSEKAQKGGMGSWEVRDDAIARGHA
jgi:hypothetical protein